MGGQGITWFCGGDLAANAIERKDRLRELVPLIRRSAVKRETQRQFRVAVHRIMRARGEFAEVAHVAVNLHVLRRNKWRIGGHLNDSAGPVWRYQQRGFVAQERG